MFYTICLLDKTMYRVLYDRSVPPDQNVSILFVNFNMYILGILEKFGTEKKQLIASFVEHLKGKP